MLEITVQIEEGAAGQMILTLACAQQTGSKAEHEAVETFMHEALLWTDRTSQNCMTVQGGAEAQELADSLAIAARRGRILPTT